MENNNAIINDISNNLYKATKLLDEVCDNLSFIEAFNESKQIHLIERLIWCMHESIQRLKVEEE
jgi:hypothetical protein